ncbi:hypothetical protein [Holophaga foetida]|uniref:hypothetical protein n=1 Tax=Holophaga foetida TaxID=35839 RepID=UPI0002472115|nr:hypothetical protein [Holophaga foetida]
MNSHSPINEPAFDTIEDTWHTSFLVRHRDTVKRVEELHLEDPKLMGALPFRAEDLDRVIRRTEEMQAWFEQFESSSGNPIWVLGVVGSWPDGDRQSYPRLVTSYRSLGVDPQEARQWSEELMAQFQAAPLKAPLLKGKLWDLLMVDGEPQRLNTAGASPQAKPGK